MISRSESEPNHTATSLARTAAATLAAIGNSLAQRDSDLLLAHILSIEPAAIPLYTAAVSNDQQARFQTMIDRRLTGEPVAYIIGEQGFWSLDFYVNQHTLIPRPDTELLVEVGLKSITSLARPTVADLGCGSGCILLSILSDHAGASGVGADISSAALDVARRNATRHDLAARTDFVESDWFSNIERGVRFDLIVSNPPYIPASDITRLMKDVRDFEPTSALDGGADGLDCYRVISQGALDHLAKNGYLAFEVGVNQSAAVCSIMQALDYREIEVYPDLAGIDRAVIGKKPQES